MIKKAAEGNDTVRILIVTDEHLISGDIELPLPSVIKNPTTENLLFYVLNSGNKFLALHNCIIQDKDNTEFQPERVDYFNVNIDIVQTCRIIPAEYI